MLYCFNLTTVDDQYVENTESHKILLQSVNQLDKVDINIATINITDNDGKINNLYELM